LSPQKLALQKALYHRPTHHIPSHLVYHYTTRAGLEGILGDRAVRATHFRHLNDKREMDGGDSLLLSVAQALSEKPSQSIVTQFALKLYCELYPRMAVGKLFDWYVSCFSDLPDAQSQWRDYGDSGRGYALGFEFKLTEPVPGAPTIHLGLVLRRMEYDLIKSRRIVEREMARRFAILEKHVTNAALSDAAIAQLLHFGVGEIFKETGWLVLPVKNRRYKDEHEWRILAMPNAGAPAGIVKFRQRDGEAVPYVNVPLVPWPHEPIDIKSLCVGPNQDPVEGVREARELLSATGHDPNVVCVSTVGRFKIKP